MLYALGTRVMVLLLGLSSLANFASASRWEQLLTGPIALVQSLLCLLVALAPPNRRLTRGAVPADG